MPEQNEMLNQFKQDQNKIDKPILSDNQFNVLNDTLIFNMYRTPYIELLCFVDSYIHKVDIHTQTLHL